MPPRLPDTPPFAALFTGHCQVCGEDWEPGAMIRYTSRFGLRCGVHDCCDAANTEPQEGDVCPSCFLRRALSGECGCQP